MVDLDHFKAVNDTYGHEVGNQALKHLAAILKGEVRTTDIVCRYGGEEFAMIFPETHLNLGGQGSRPHPRGNPEYARCSWMDGEIEMTASMGASVYMKTSVLDIEEFVDSVDKYLYEAKQSGRNCICHIDYHDLRAVTEIGADERAMLINSE